jgi:excisionase family DNA binding protein
VKDYYTIKEFADKLQVHPHTVRDWITKGVVEAVQMTKKGKFYINKLDVPAFMRDREVKNEKS